MTAPADREFAVFPRGYIRDKIILANFRNGLRALTNPETGQPFTEDEIQRATQQGGRWWSEANAIDLMGMSQQRNAIYLSDQTRIERASTSFLHDFHGRMWKEGPLAATGGAGEVLVPAVAGTIIVGDPEPEAPGAYWARDPAGNRFQVFATVVTPAGGVATVTMFGIDTGAATNLDPGTKLVWTLRDPSMAPEASVGAAQFTGGTDKETDAQFASRLLGRIAHKPAAGNDPHNRAWARESSNAVEDAFVYPIAFHAGSMLVAITQKRAGVKGPLARIPSSSTLAAAIAYMTPPTSPVVPTPPHVVVTPSNAESSDMVLRLSMALGTDGGWKDPVPFPAYHATTPKLTTVSSQTDIRVTAPGDATLPGQPALATLTGDDAPQMMVWDEARSEFVELAISSVEDLGSNVFRILLSAAPATMTLAVNQIVSPLVPRHAIVSEALTDYFDELGPGDLFDVTTDPRGARGLRFPDVSEERPFRAGAVAATRVIEALGGSASDATLDSISLTEPSYPTDLTDGPNMLVPGTVGVYTL